MAPSVAGASTDAELATELIQLLGPRAASAWLADRLADPLFGDTDGGEAGFNHAAEAEWLLLARPDSVLKPRDCLGISHITKN